MFNFEAKQKQQNKQDNISESQNLFAQSNILEQITLLNETLRTRQQNQSLLSRKSINYNQFKTNNKILTYLGGSDKSKNPSIFLGKQSLSYKNVFHVRINNSLNNNIGIGVCSESFLMNKDCLGKNAFILLNLGTSQIIIGPNQIISLKYKLSIKNEDEIITLVDMANDRVQWYINDLKVSQYSLKNVGMSGCRIIVPLIRFVDQNDSIQWVKQYTFGTKKEQSRNIYVYKR